MLNLPISNLQATEVLEEKGLTSMDTGDGNTSRKVRVRYCNIPLPETKPLASRESVCVERLFIVSQPDSFDEDILQDCFCRFGNLIDVYFMPGLFYFLILYLIFCFTVTKMALKFFFSSINCLSRKKRQKIGCDFRYK